MYRHKVVTAGLVAALTLGGAPIVAHATNPATGPAAGHTSQAATGAGQAGPATTDAGQTAPAATGDGSAATDASADGAADASATSSNDPTLSSLLTDGKIAGGATTLTDAPSYAPDDIVTLIVQLQGGNNDERSLFGLGASPRDEVKSQIAGIVNDGAIPFGLGAPALDVTHDYYNVMQGFSVRVPYKYLDQIRGLDGVKNAFPEHAYSVPTDQGSDGAASGTAASGNTDQYMNGNSLAMVGAGANGLTGKHTTTAIIDSGLDVNHEAFSGKLDADSLDLTKDEIDNVADDPAFHGDANYVSDKIPYAHDYADNDDDVVPHADGLEHGTHVAGIIGANGGEKIRGVSPDTQLLGMKVASDATGALYDSAIIAALDDATQLDVDSINMSLGSDAGFPDDSDATYNDIYDAVRARGIQLNVAAGNSTNAAQGNKSGQNKPYATDPDYSIVSSPATYNSALAVASVNALDKGMYLQLPDGQQFPYIASSADTATLDSLNATLEVVDAGYGHPDEIPDTITGKVALISRGSDVEGEQFNFSDKVKNAADKGAAAVIIYNNVTGDGDDTVMSVDDSRVPSVFVTKEAGEAIKAAKSITVSPKFSHPSTKMTMSDFSSWGVSPNLELKPEVTAPGGQIYSSVLNNSYEYMSGTSMATPQVSGLASSMYQYLEGKYPNKDKTEIYDLSESLLMSTAAPVPDGDGSYVSPRKQGAGEANLSAASSSPAYLSVKGADPNKPKADLGDSADGTFSFTLTVHNLSDKQLSYTLDAAALGEDVADGLFQGTSTNYAGKGVDVSYSGDGVANGAVSVPANGTTDVTVSIKAGDAFKAYAANTPNGTFLDGFVFLKSADQGGVDLSVPYLGFYGDWEKIPAFDTAQGTTDASGRPAQAHMFETIVGSPDSSAMLGGNPFAKNDDGSTVAQKNDPTRFAISPTSNADLFKRFTTNTGLLRNLGKLDYVVTPKDNPDDVVRQYSYDAVRKSYYVPTAQATTYAEAFLHGDKPIIDTKDSQGNQLPDGWYTFSERAYAMSPDDPSYNTVDDTYSFDFYVDSQAPTVSTKVEGTGDDRVLKVTVTDAHYVSAVNVVSFDGQTSLGSKIESQADAAPVEKDGRRTYTFSYKYADIKAASMGIDPSQVRVYAYDYAMNRADANVTLNSSYPYNISFNEATGGDTDYDGTWDNPLTVGNDLDLTVSFEPDDTSERKLTWESSDPSKVTVDENGVVSAVAPTEDGKPITVTATAHADPSDSSATPATATLSFNVQAIPAEAGIVTNRSTLDLDIDKTATLRATTTDALKGETVTWASSNEDVATVTSNNDGTATVTGKMSGSADITASVTKGDKTYKATTKLSVSDANDRLYDMDENGVITGYHGTSADLVLPTNATGIADGVFQGLTVKSVTLNSGLKTIGASAFQGDEELTTLTIPADSQLESIGDNAFDGDKSLGGDLVMPSTLKTLGTAAFQGTVITGMDLSATQLTEIADDAFNGDSQLSSAKLPSSGLTRIGARAFKGTVSLGNLELPEGLETIDDEAFNGGALINLTTPTSLKSIGVTALGGLPLGSVTLNEGLESIGDTAFSGVGATELTIPGSVKAIGANAFEGMGSLRTISLGGDNPVPTSPFVQDYSLRTIEVRDGAKYLANGSEGELMDKSQETLVAYPLGALPQNASYTVPESVKTIAPWAFYGASNLTGLKLGTHLEQIGDHAFMTSNVAEVVVPKDAALTTIGNDAFYLDKNLKKVDLGTSVKTIGDYVFSESPVLTDVNLGRAETIGEFAFAKSTALESFVIPDSVTSVGSSVIQNSDKIKTVHIGKNVPSVDSDSFVGLSALERIDVTEGNAALQSADGVLYTKGEKGALTLTRYPSAKTDAEYTAPAGVVAVADFGMADNPNIKKATFGDGLTSIGTSAFNGDTALAELNLPDSVTTVGSVPFMDTALETVRLGSQVTTFDGTLGPFSYAGNLKHIVIGGGHDLAVPENTELPVLETLYLGPGVTSLSGGAFSAASKLGTVIVDTDLTDAPANSLPKGVTVYVADGHDATASLLRGQGFTVKPYARLSVSLKGDPVTAKPGEKVTLTAQAAGGIGSNQYRFASVAADGTETELQGWGTSNVLKDFTVPEGGTAQVRVYVRDASQVEAKGDATVGAELGAGTYAVSAQLLTADGTATSPLDALLARSTGSDTAFARVKVADDGSADVTLPFAAGHVTGVTLRDASGASTAAVTAPADAYTVHVAAGALGAPIDVAVATDVADAATPARLVLNVGSAVGSANVADLAGLLDHAAALNPTRYTDDTWAALVAARDKAQGVYDTVGATQEAVNAAADALRAAIAGLKGATTAEWPADGLYNVAISGQNMLVTNGMDMFGTTAQLQKDDTGTYLLLTMRPATVGDTMGATGEMDASMVKQFLYYKGDDASQTYDAGKPVWTSEDGKSATWRLAIDDVKQTVTTRVWWNNGTPIAQPLDPTITLGTITPATEADADPDGQAALAKAYNKYAALPLDAYADGDAKDAFTKALEAAKELLANPEATKEQLSDALKALEAAAKKLAPKVGADELADVVSRFEGAYVEGGYTKASWKAYADALAKAKALGEGAKDAERSAAADELLRAALALNPAANTSALSGAISAAEGVKLDDYADGAEKDEFQAALEAARALVGQDLGADAQDQVDDAALRLAKAQGVLSGKLKPADTSALQKVVDAAKALDLSQYVDGTEKDAFTKALSDAESLLGDKSLTIRDQRRVDDAAHALANAQDGLRKKDDAGQQPGGSGQQPGDTNDNGAPNGGGNKGGAGNGAGSGPKGGNGGTQLPQTSDQGLVGGAAATGALGAAIAAIGTGLRRWLGRR